MRNLKWQRGPQGSHTATSETHWYSINPVERSEYYLTITEVKSGHLVCQELVGCYYLTRRVAEAFEGLHGYRTPSDRPGRTRLYMAFVLGHAAEELAAEAA